MKTIGCRPQEVSLSSEGTSVVVVLPAQRRADVRRNESVRAKTIRRPDASTISSISPIKPISPRLAAVRARVATVVESPEAWENFVYLVLWVSSLFALASCFGALN